MIPDEAVEAALYAYGVDGKAHEWERKMITDILEAALPILLSHEREETRLAHLDAMVNAATVDRLEGELAEAWERGKHSASGLSVWAAQQRTNPYRK